LLVQMSQPMEIVERLGIFATCDLNIGAIVLLVKIVSICATILVALRFVALLLSSNGVRIGLMFKLWLEAKERRLRERAGESN